MNKLMLSLEDKEWTGPPCSFKRVRGDEIVLYRRKGNGIKRKKIIKQFHQEDFNLVRKIFNISPHLVYIIIFPEGEDYRLNIRFVTPPGTEINCRKMEERIMELLKRNK